MRRWHVGLTAVVMGAVVVSLVAGGALAGPRVSGTPFKIMYATGINVNINNYPEALSGAKAAAAAINSATGFKGRPVEIVECNHLGTAVGAAACAQQAVDQKVDWFLTYNPNFSAGAGILDNAKIPYAGSASTTPADFKNANLHPSIGPGNNAVASACYAAVKAKGKGARVAFITFDLASAIATKNVCRLAAIKAGGKFVGSVGQGATAVDWAPAVLKAKSFNPDIVGVATGQSQNIAIYRAAQQFGLNVIWAQSGLIATEQLIADAGAKSFDIFAGTAVPNYRQNSAGIKRYAAQMTAAGYAKDIPAVVGVLGWVQVQALKAAADSIKGSAPLTNASLLSAIDNAPKTGLDVQGFMRWYPTLKGPSLSPNSAFGGMFVARAKGDGILRPIGTKAFDSYAQMGIGKTPGLTTG